MDVVVPGGGVIRTMTTSREIVGRRRRRLRRLYRARSRGRSTRPATNSAINKVLEQKTGY
jgi:hypothetical protein